MSRTTCAKCNKPLNPGARFCELCGTRVEPDRRPLAVRLQEDLGQDFMVMGELGRGGFAEVFLVRDNATGKHLAVKVMLDALMISSNVVKRFQREISYASELRHPNIVPVSFSKESIDLVYYAMPRVRGKSLKKLIMDAGRLPIDETVNILKQLAEGLAYAHEHGIIHRDIKPSNLMIAEDGTVKILDFGVAKALSKKGTILSISGELLGSPEYMSPEQASGSKELNHKTDIYSFGIVGFEMLSGKPPFMGSSVQQLLHLHVAGAPPSLQELRPDLPSSVVTAINRCLEKDPATRWPNIRAAASALSHSP